MPDTSRLDRFMISAASLESSYAADLAVLRASINPDRCAAKLFLAIDAWGERFDIARMAFADRWCEVIEGIPE